MGIGQAIDLRVFIKLKQQELNSENNELVDKLEICTQSIHRWLQYCQYHYVNLGDTSKDTDLKLDRISVYR